MVWAVLRGLNRIVLARFALALFVELVFASLMFWLIYRFAGAWLCTLLCPGVRRG